MRVGSAANNTATRCVIHLDGTFLIAQLMEALQTNAAQLAGAAGQAAEAGTRFLSQLAIQLIDPPHAEHLEHFYWWTDPEHRHQRSAIDWTGEGARMLSDTAFLRSGERRLQAQFPIGQQLENLRTEIHIQIFLRTYVVPGGTRNTHRLPLLPLEIWQLILCIVSNRIIIAGFENPRLEAALDETRNN